MSADLQIDTREFKAALQQYFHSTSRGLAEVINQRAFNVAARAMDTTRPAPGNEQGQRNAIAKYLREPLSQRIRRVKGGKRKGKFIKAGRRENQLQRVHLIVQARNAKMGRRGLYGSRMARVSGYFKRTAANSVGFMKSPYIPVIKGLLPYVRFRKVNTRWGRISVWPGSAGYGRVKVAKPGFDPFAEMQMRWRLASENGSKAASMATQTLQNAFSAEADEMIRHVQRKMQGDADRINRR